MYQWCKQLQRLFCTFSHQIQAYKEIIQLLLLKQKRRNSTFIDFSTENIKSCWVSFPKLKDVKTYPTVVSIGFLAQLFSRKYLQRPESNACFIRRRVYLKNGEVFPPNLLQSKICLLECPKRIKKNSTVFGTSIINIDIKSCWASFRNGRISKVT